MAKQLSVNKHHSSKLERDYQLAKKITEAVGMFRYEKGRANGLEVSDHFWKRCEELWRLVN